MNQPVVPPAPKTISDLLDEIKSYFAILANTERLSLAETDEPDVLCLQDANSIGGNGLDLVESLRALLEADVTASTASAKDGCDQHHTRLGELTTLPLDRVVTVYLQSGHSFTGALAESPTNQIILFEPRSEGKSLYHVIPIDRIDAWTDIRGKQAEPLFLYDGQYLTRGQISQQETCQADALKP